MGHYHSRYWQADGIGMTKKERMGGKYHPYSPHMLTELRLSLEPIVAAAIAEGQEAIRSLNKESHILTSTEPLARILLRSEAISSSRIEGLEVPTGKLLVQEELNRLGVPSREDSTEVRVLGNIRALHDGLDSVAEGQPIELSDILDLNRSLLRNTRLSEFGGVIRTTQNWIGGNSVNPVGAAYVPPEPQEVNALLNDLISFINTSELPPLAVAALAHAQFETIHPFADGNGRTGRALIHLILRSRGVETRITPPVSLVLATFKESYLDGLASFRCEGDDQIVAASNGWLEFFAQCTITACRRAILFEKTLDDIRDGWRKRISFRAKSAGSLLLDVLPGTPVVSISTASSLIGRSYPATRNAILALVDEGILHQNSRNRKSGIYVAEDIVTAFTSYERALATVEGDTSIEKPRRHVPQRIPKR